MMTDYMQVNSLNYKLLDNAPEQFINVSNDIMNLPNDVMNNLYNDNIMPKYEEKTKVPIDDRFARFFEPADRAISFNKARSLSIETFSNSPKSTESIINKIPITDKVASVIKTTSTLAPSIQHNESKIALKKKFLKIKLEIEPKIMRKFGETFNKSLNLKEGVKLFDISSLHDDVLIKTSDLINNLSLDSQKIINFMVIKYINAYTNKIRELVSKEDLTNSNKRSIVIEKYSNKIFNDISILIFIVFKAMHKTISHLPKNILTNSKKLINSQIDSAISQIIINLYQTLKTSETIDPIKKELASSLSRRVNKEMAKKGKLHVENIKYRIKAHKYKDLCLSVKKILRQAGLSIETASLETPAVAERIISIMKTCRDSVSPKIPEHLKKDIKDTVTKKTIEIKDAIKMSLVQQGYVPSVASTMATSKAMAVKKEIEKDVKKFEILKDAIKTALVKQGADPKIATSIATKAVDVKSGIKELLIKQGVDTKIASIVATKKATDLKKIIKAELKKEGKDSKSASAIAKPIVAEIKKAVDVKQSVSPKKDEKIKEVIKSTLIKQGAEQKVASTIANKAVDVKKIVEKELIKKGVDIKTASIVATKKATDLKEIIKAELKKEGKDSKSASVVTKPIVAEIKNAVAMLFKGEDKLKDTIKSSLMKQGAESKVASKIAGKAIEIKKDIKAELIKTGIAPKIASVMATAKAIDLKKPIKDELKKDGRESKDASKIASVTATIIKKEIIKSIKSNDEKLKNAVKEVLIKKGVEPKIASTVASKTIEIKKDIKDTLIKQGVPSKIASPLAIEKTIKYELKNGFKVSSKDASPIIAEIKKIAESKQQSVSPVKKDDKLMETVKASVSPVKKDDKLMETVKASLIKQGIDNKTATSIATNAEKVKNGIENELIKKGIDPKLASIVATKKAIELKNKDDKISSKIVTELKKIIDAKSIVSPTKDEKLKDAVKKAIIVQKIDVNKAKEIGSKVVEIKKIIKNELIKQGVDTKIASAIAKEQAIDLKKPIKDVLIKNGMSPKIASIIATTKSVDIKKDIKDMFLIKPTSPVIKQIVSASKEISPVTSPTVTKSIEMIKMLKPDEMAKKLAVNEIKGVTLDKKNRELVYTVIISAIKTMISQIQAIPEPIHPNYKQFLSRLMVFITNEKRIMKLASKVASSEHFVESLHVEQFNNNSFDDVMSTIQNNILEMFDETTIEGFDGCEPCDENGYNWYMIILFTIIVVIVSYFMYKRYA
jgi:hypothetical protein